MYLVMDVFGDRIRGQTNPRILYKEISEFQTAGHRDLEINSLPLILFCRSLLLTSAGNRMWGWSFRSSTAVLLLKSSNSECNSGYYCSSHPFHQDFSEASSGICYHFSSVQQPLWVIPEKGSKKKVLKRMTVIVTWFHSYKKALNPPSIHSLTEYKTQTIGLKIFKNGCLYKQLFYLQNISLWSKYCTYDHKFFIMCLKMNKQRIIEELQQAFLLNFLKIQKWLLGGTFQTYVLKSVFSETTKMSQSLCLFVIAHFRRFLILCQSELDEILQECVLQFFF